MISAWWELLKWCLYCLLEGLFAGIGTDLSDWFKNLFDWEEL